MLKPGKSHTNILQTFSRAGDDTPLQNRHQ